MKNAVKNRKKNEKSTQDVHYLGDRGSIEQAKWTGEKSMKGIIQEHYLELKRMSF